jgi:hypothetical protein
MMLPAVVRSQLSQLQVVSHMFMYCFGTRIQGCVLVFTLAILAGEATAQTPNGPSGESSQTPKTATLPQPLPAAAGGPAGANIKFEFRVSLQWIPCNYLRSFRKGSEFFADYWSLLYWSLHSLPLLIIMYSMFLDLHRQ